MRPRRPTLLLLLLALASAGCAIPSWVPLTGKPKPAAPLVSAGPADSQPGLPAPGRAQLPAADEVLDRVIGVVNNDAITQFELDEAEAYYLYETKERAPEGEARRALRERLVGRMVENRLQLQQAEREKITVEDPELAEQLNELMKKLNVNGEPELQDVLKAQGLNLEGAKKRIRDQILVQKIIRRRVGLRISVIEQEIDRYLSENREKLETGLAFEARHILLPPTRGGSDEGWEEARRQAEDVHAKLEAGEDFAELAQKSSEDGSAKDGGSLGQLKRGELAPEIEAAILRLNPGEHSAPFRSGIGYHLFKLESKESLAGPALTQARNQIREILYREKYQARLNDWLAEIKQRAIIDLRL